MKTRLNITIDNEVLNEMKQFSQRKSVSLSRMVEEYFITIIKKRKSKNSLLDQVATLPPHSLNRDLDLKQSYYSEKYHSNGG